MQIMIIIPGGVVEWWSWSDNEGPVIVTMECL